MVVTVTAYAKGALLSPMRRCILTHRTIGGPVECSHWNPFRARGTTTFQQRNLSASSQKKANRNNKRKPPLPTPEQQQQQQQQQQVPRWATTASVLVVPFMFAAWGVSDWLFGNRNKGHNEELRQMFLQEQQTLLSGNDNNNNNNDNDAWLNSLDAKPTLFYCVIRTNSGLTHCLSGVRLGDVVDVLEEGVGPNQDYNLCRLRARGDDNDGPFSRDTYGWFPIRWLQKLDHYDSIAREQQGLSKKDEPKNNSRSR